MTCQSDYQPPQCEVDYGQLIPGDILLFSEGRGNFTRLTEMPDWAQTFGYGGAWHHAAIYLGDGLVADAGVPDGILITPLENEDFRKAASCGIYRVQTDDETRRRAVDYARDQEGAPYNWRLYDKQRTDSFQCAQFVWRAYYEASNGTIDLDDNRGTPVWLDASFPDLVVPDNLAYSNNVSYVSGELNPDLFHFWFFSPATLLLTDEQGRRAGFDPATGTVIGEIPGAIFDMQAEPKYLIIPEAQYGTYDLAVAGTGDGNYTLRLARNDSIEGIVVTEQTGTISAGELHNYRVTFTADVPPILQLTSTDQFIPPAPESSSELGSTSIMGLSISSFLIGGLGICMLGVLGFMAVLVVVWRFRRQATAKKTSLPASPSPPPAKSHTSPETTDLVFPKGFEPTTSQPPASVSPSPQPPAPVATPAPPPAEPLVPPPQEREVTPAESVSPQKPLAPDMDTARVSPPESTPAPDQAPAAAPSSKPQTPAQPAETVSQVDPLQQGISYVKQGDVAKGYAILRRVIEQTPDNAEAWLWLGWAMVKKDKRNTRRCFLQAQQLGHPQAAQALDWLDKQG